MTATGGSGDTAGGGREESSCSANQPASSAVTSSTLGASEGVSEVRAVGKDEITTGGMGSDGGGASDSACAGSVNGAPETAVGATTGAGGEARSGADTGAEARAGAAAAVAGDELRFADGSSGMRSTLMSAPRRATSDSTASSKRGATKPLVISSRGEAPAITRSSRLRAGSGVHAK